jgi:hypothetical protein
MAGFEVTPYGRFCLTPEVHEGQPSEGGQPELFPESRFRGLPEACA